MNWQVLIIMPSMVTPIWSILIEDVPTFSVMLCIASWDCEPRLVFSDVFPRSSLVSMLPMEITVEGSMVSLLVAVDLFADGRALVRVREPEGR